MGLCCSAVLALCSAASCHFIFLIFFYDGAASSALFTHSAANHLRRGEGGGRGKQVLIVSSAAGFAALLSSRPAWWESNSEMCLCSSPQVDSITSMLRGAVVTRAFEQTKCFTPARGLQGTLLIMQPCA